MAYYVTGQYVRGFFNDEAVECYSFFADAITWCTNHIGPYGKRWEVRPSMIIPTANVTYGRYIAGPIVYVILKDPYDATIFKIAFPQLIIVQSEYDN